MIDARGIRRYCELLYIFSVQELKARYKQTLLGFMWALFQPLILMIIFTVVFGYMVRIPTEGVPYSLFVIVGIVPWQLFANSTARGASCLVQNTNLIIKSPSPREIFPMASITVNLVDFFIAWLLIIPMMIYHDMTPSIKVFMIPLIIVLELIITMAFVFFLSAVNVILRDIGFIIPLLLQAWFFATPVFYPMTIIPEKYHWVFNFNPMVPIVQGFRGMLLPNKPIPYEPLLYWGCASIVMIVFAYLFFKRLEPYFAERL